MTALYGWTALTSRPSDIFPDVTTWHQRLFNGYRLQRVHEEWQHWWLKTAAWELGEWMRRLWEALRPTLPDGIYVRLVEDLAPVLTRKLTRRLPVPLSEVDVRVLSDEPVEAVRYKEFLWRWLETRGKRLDWRAFDQLVMHEGASPQELVLEVEDILFLPGEDAVLEHFGAQ